MKCPFKFGRYKFEGGEECIGNECGMHKLCHGETACDACEWPSLAAMPDLEQQRRIAEQDRTIVEYAEKNAELQAKVDELTRENARLSSDELHHCIEIDTLRRNVDARRRIEAQMRALLDGATLVDEKGEVVA